MRRFLVLAVMTTGVGCSDKGSPAPPPPSAPAPAPRTASDQHDHPLGMDRPTMEQCEHALEHLVDLEVAAAPGSGPEARQAVVSTTRARFFDSCMQGRRATLDCIIAAPDLDAAARCDAAP